MSKSKSLQNCICHLGFGFDLTFELWHLSSQARHPMSPSLSSLSDYFLPNSTFGSSFSLSSAAKNSSALNLNMLAIIFFGTC